MSLHASRRETARHGRWPAFVTLGAAAAAAPVLPCRAVATAAVLPLPVARTDEVSARQHRICAASRGLGATGGKLHAIARPAAKCLASRDF